MGHVRVKREMCSVLPADCRGGTEIRWVADGLGVGRSNVGEKEWSAIPIHPCRHRTSRFWNPDGMLQHLLHKRVGNSFRIYKRNSLPKGTVVLITSRFIEWGYIN